MTENNAHWQPDLAALLDTSMASFETMQQEIDLYLAQARAKAETEALTKALSKIIGEERLTRWLQELETQGIPKSQSSFDALLSEVENLIHTKPDRELKTLLKNAEPEVVRNAIQALKEALEEERAARPKEYLRAAIRGKWTPNRKKASQWTYRLN